MQIDPAVAVAAAAGFVWLGALEWRVRRLEQVFDVLKRIEISTIVIKAKLGIPIGENDVNVEGV